MRTTTQPGTVARSVGPALLVAAATVAAWIAVVAGVALGVFALTGSLVPSAPVRIGPSAPAWSEEVLPCVAGWSIDGVSGCEPSVRSDVWPGGASLPVEHAGGLVVSSSDVTPAVALLGTAPTWAWLVAGGAGVLLLVPVVRTTAAGRPFDQGNARRLGAAAAVVAGAWVLVTAGPALAAPALIHAVAASRPAVHGTQTFSLPAGWLVPDHRLVWWPLVVVVLVAVLAAATRHGTRLAADTEGLV